MSLDEIWRKASEYLPGWARTTFFTGCFIGQGLSEAAKALHPSFDYQAVSFWGWYIFGQFVAFPPVWLWRTLRRKISGPNAYDSAEEFVRIIKMTMAEAKMSKVERTQQWRNIFGKLYEEIQIGTAPPKAAKLAAEIGITRTESPTPG